MKNLTIYYVVGGNDCHYTNLLQSVRSVRKLTADTPIKIFDFSGKWKYGPEDGADNVEVVDLPNEIDFSKKKIGYLFWRQKYVRALDIDTQYAMYVDTDTVLVNDTFKEITKSIGTGIGSAKHWWVPDFNTFLNVAVPEQNKLEFINVCQKIYDPSEPPFGEKPFYAGGVFVFKNNKNNKSLMQKVIDVYDDVYTGDSEYVKGITDEVFFSGVCKGITDLGGSLNHCCMGDQHMDLKIENGKVVGKNSYEETWSPITFFHCDTSRRDPSENYQGELKEKIRSLFYE